jgi:hypothetical protein
MELGQAYYDIQAESLAAVLARYSPRKNSVATTDAWLNMYHANKWSKEEWANINEDIKARYDSASEFIACVTDMFKDMHYNDEQADMMVRLLCDTNIDEKPRNEMIAAWNTYMLLRPFNNDVIPIQNNKSLDKCRDAALVRFRSAVLECLPIAEGTAGLSYALASTQIKVQEMVVADSMLSVANVNMTPPKTCEVRKAPVLEMTAGKGATKRIQEHLEVPNSMKKGDRKKVTRTGSRQQLLA